MPAGVPKTLIDAAAEAVRDLAWYFGYRTGAGGPRDISTRSRRQLLLDVGAQRRGRLERALAGCHELAILDDGPALHLARGRDQEGLPRLQQLVARHRPLRHVHQSQHAIACDRGEDV